MTANLNLKENIDFLLSEKDKLHVNDPIKSIILSIIENLLLVDKEETLKYIKKIDDEKTMLQISTFIFSSGIVKFPNKKFVESCKKQIDKFKDSKQHPVMLMDYDKALKYLEMEKNFKEEKKNK